jgi:hypothetical protein
MRLAKAGIPSFLIGWIIISHCHAVLINKIRKLLNIFFFKKRIMMQELFKKFLKEDK